MKTLALALLLSSTAAYAQEDPVILFGPDNDIISDVSFLYNPTTNTASNINTDYFPTAACAAGLPETATVTRISDVQGLLSIGGTISLTGCTGELGFGGTVLLDPPFLSEGTGGASFINVPAVPEPSMLLLCAMGIVGLGWRLSARVPRPALQVSVAPGLKRTCRQQTRYRWQ
jgi:hypothetical protein